MERCGATVRRTGEPCKKWPIHGSNRCGTHGGRAPQVKAKAAERVTEQKMRSTLGRLTIRPVEDPLTELSKLAGEVVAWKELAAEHVAKLERLRYSSESGEHVLGEILIFERALDRCASVLGLIAKLNIDERLVRIEKQRADLMMQVLASIWDDLGFDAAQRREANAHVARHLRVVPGRPA